MYDSWYHGQYLFLFLFRLLFCFVLLPFSSPHLAAEEVGPFQTSDSSPFGFSEQILIITAPLGESKAWFSFYELFDGEWRTVWEKEPVWIGRSGFFPASSKREGDGATPTGNYPILRLYSRHSDSKISFPIIPLRTGDHWDANPTSTTYNQKIPKRLKGAISLAQSAIYRSFFVIEHNTREPKPGKGSMLFVHLWDEKRPTSGCIGIPNQLFVSILERLDAKKNPYLVLVPQDGLGN